MPKPETSPDVCVRDSWMPVTVGSLLVRKATYLVPDCRFSARLSNSSVVMPAVELKVSTAVLVTSVLPTVLTAWFWAFVPGFHCATFNCSEAVWLPSA